MKELKAKFSEHYDRQFPSSYTQVDLLDDKLGQLHADLVEEDSFLTGLVQKVAREVPLTHEEIYWLRPPTSLLEAFRELQQQHPEHSNVIQQYSSYCEWLVSLVNLARQVTAR